MDGFYLEIAKIILENEYAIKKHQEVMEKILEKYSEEKEKNDEK